MLPKISVVVPTFRRPEFLVRALVSIEMAAQNALLDRESVEIIVVDDGHDDASRAACDGAGRFYPIGYRRTTDGPRAGPARARNEGVYAAKGKYIYFVDDDDQFLPNRFRRSLQLLRSGEYDLVLENVLRIPQDGSGRAPFLTGPTEPVDADAFTYTFTCGERGHIAPNGMAFTRKLFVDAGGLDDELTHMGEDGEMLARLCAVGRTKLLPGDPVGIVIIHGHNTSRPDRQFYWYNIKNLRHMIRNLRRLGCHDRIPFVKRFTTHKLDFFLSQIRFEERSYVRRLARGAQVLWHFPLQCLTWRNVRSLGVFLLKGRAR